MIFESIFLISGGSFGNDWVQKLIIAIIGIIACLYDYMTNEKRLDYFWVFLTGTLEFWVMVYDTIFEITLVYSPFLAIPYLLGLIKSEEVVVKN